MKVLVVPDVHLKRKMFQDARNILDSGRAECAVFLGDLIDDWNRENDLELYARTLEDATAFATDYPNSLWCYGNHDLSYQIPGAYETGYSRKAESVAKYGLQALRQAAGERLKYIHRIDQVVFLHGGISKYFVLQNVPEKYRDDIDFVIEYINDMPMHKMWQDTSPVWLRPQHGGILWHADDLIQVVGHTPMDEVELTGNLISCDVFSTHRNGEPIGTEEYVIIETKDGSIEKVKQ